MVSILTVLATIWGELWSLLFLLFIPSSQSKGVVEVEVAFWLIPLLVLSVVPRQGAFLGLALIALAATSVFFNIAPFALATLLLLAGGFVSVAQATK